MMTMRQNTNIEIIEIIDHFNGGGKLRGWEIIGGKEIETDNPVWNFDRYVYSITKPDDIKEDCVYCSGDSLIKILKIINDNTAIYIKFSKNHKVYTLTSDYIEDLQELGFKQETISSAYSFFVDIGAEDLQ